MRGLRHLFMLLGKLRRPWILRGLVFLAAITASYLALFNYTEPTEVGIARNAITGTVWLQKDGAWHFTAPWVKVAVVDLRPVRVSVDSAGHGYSAKLVQFDPEGWQEFVAIEGFRYYWWDNRLSINLGYKEEHRGMKDTLRGHAYGTKKYRFLKVLTEYQ